MRREVLDQLLRDRAARRPAVLATTLATGAQLLLHPAEARPEGVPDPVWEAALAAVESGRVGEVFLQVFAPALRLAIVGAVHVAQPLVRMAELAGFSVTVIDPRRAWATPERFPDVTLVPDWPDEALAALGVDARTALVTLTHDPKIDDPALLAALRSPAFYIGALGSKKTHATRCARLREAGFGDADVARIHGPVGLSIGARSAAEIAVSILAQIVATLRGGAR